MIFVLDSFFLPFFSLLGPAFLILISWLICIIPFSSRCKTSGGLISFSFCQRGCLSIAPFFHFSPKQLPGSWKSLRETEIGAWSILEGQGPYEAGSTLPYDRLIRTKRTRDTFIDNRSDQRFSYIRKAGLSLLRDFTTTTGWRSEHLLPNNNRACLHQRIYTGSRSFPSLRSTPTTTNVQSRLPRCKFTLYLLFSTPVFVRARDGRGCIYSPYTAVSVLSFLCLFLFYVCTLCWDPRRCG